MIHRVALLLLALLLVGLSTLAPLAPAGAADFKAPLARLEPAEGDTIVFLGDSITHQCLYTQYIEDYFYTRFPKARIGFHNSGVGGDRANDALIRFERDVAHYKPKYVTVLLGMNDGSYQPYNDEVFQTYRTDMTELIERICSIGATPILMTPTMYDARAARIRKKDGPEDTIALYNSVLAYFGAWLRERAAEQGHGFVDMYGPLNNLTLERRKTQPDFTMIGDAVHPEAPGQLVMAFAVLNDMGVPRPVSSIQVFADVKGKPMIQATGGKAGDVQFTSDGVEFDFTGDSLPLAVPEEAQLGAVLVNLGHRMSREALEVHGLAAGQYQLLIDGEPVGRYSNVMLDRHIELQSNTKTPQYRQALAVAELNKQRNDEAVRPLRNVWREKKQLRRLKAQLDASPDDEALQRSFAAQEKKLADFEDQLAGLEAKAKEFEDRIYQLNQPGKHHYQLVRLKPSKE